MAPQIPALARGVPTGWQWVSQALAAQTQAPEVQTWGLTVLWPWLYWSQPADKTRTPHLKHRYQQAASEACDTPMMSELTLSLSEAAHLLGGRGPQWLPRPALSRCSRCLGHNAPIPCTVNPSRLELIPLR